LLNGKSPLPRPKQDVRLSKWLDGSLHIFFNNQEISFIELNEKPKKKIYKIRKPAKDHPLRKMNNKIAEGKKLQY
jgi:hypothetical protein